MNTNVNYQKLFLGIILGIIGTLLLTLNLWGNEWYKLIPSLLVGIIIGLLVYDHKIVWEVIKKSWIITKKNFQKIKIKKTKKPKVKIDWKKPFKNSGKITAEIGILIFALSPAIILSFIFTSTSTHFHLELNYKMFWTLLYFLLFTVIFLFFILFSSATIIFLIQDVLKIEQRNNFKFKIICKTYTALKKLAKENHFNFLDIFFLYFDLLFIILFTILGIINFLKTIFVFFIFIPMVITQTLLTIILFFIFLFKKIMENGWRILLAWSIVSGGLIGTFFHSYFIGISAGIISGIIPIVINYLIPKINVAYFFTPKMNISLAFWKKTSLIKKYE